MLLKGIDGNELELSFVRETLPETQDGFGDEAWCTVIVRAATGEDEWEENAPCLNVFEFTNLAEWLEAVGAAQDATGSPEVSEIELLEPELKFSVAKGDQNAVKIRVGFHLEERPEEFGVDAPTPEATYIDIQVNREVCLAAASSLRSAIETVTGKNPGKDDLLGEQSPGVMGLPDDDLNLIDGESEEPPGAGFGEDNSGAR